MDVEAGSTPAPKVRRPSRRSRSRSVSSIDACLPQQPLFSARRKKYRRSVYESSGNVFNHSIVSPPSSSSSSSQDPEPDQWETEALPLTLKDLLASGCDSSRTLRIVTVIVMTLMGFLVIFPIAPRFLAALAV